MKALIVSFLCLGTLVAQAQSTPPENGVYIQNGQTWTKLYLDNSSGVKNKGVAKSAFSYGIASAKTVIIFRDAKAPVRIDTSRPVFRITGQQADPRQIVIVRLQQEKDHRELQVASSRAFSGVNYEYPAHDTTEVQVKQDGPTLIVTPVSDLRPGEYILFPSSPSPMPMGSGGYDFSVGESR